jgi:hypothetical protein
MRAKPAVVKGEPRSLTNTKGEDSLSRCGRAQRPELVASQGMGARRAVLDPTDVQYRGAELDLVPAQVAALGGPAE